MESFDYKEANDNFLINRINNDTIENESIELEIIKVLLKFKESLKPKDQVHDSDYETNIVYYLNKIYKTDPERFDMCNHPCFISNSIFQTILSLFTPGTPFIVISSASLAISSFSYLFSMYPDSNCQFNMSILFLILQPEILFFIFNCIKDGIKEDISSIVKMLREYCISSKKFRDDLISAFPINSISELIRYGTENNCDISWVRDIIRLVCDISFYPIDEQDAASIFSIFEAFDLFTTPIEIVYHIFHSIRYIVEKNISEKDNEATEVNNSQIGSFFGGSWNPAQLFLKWKYYDQLDRLLDEMNRVKNYRDDSYKKLLTRIKDDICSISISIYLLTDKEVLLLPIYKFIDFMKYDEKEAGEIKVKQNLVYNALIFFSYFMNEKEENYILCNQQEFFNNLGPAIDKLPAKIRILAGHVFFGLIQKADRNLLSNLLYQEFFVWAFKLIQDGDAQLGIEMLIVMQIFIQFVIESNDIHLADTLRYFYDEYRMDETLNDLFYNDDDSNAMDNENHLSSFAGQTLEMIRNCYVQYDFMDASKNEFYEEEEDENDLFPVIQGEEEYQYDDNNDDEINFEKADQIFSNTKPDPWISAFK